MPLATHHTESSNQATILIMTGWENGGHVSKLTTADIDHARRMIESGAESVAGMARILKVGRNTLGRALRVDRVGEGD